MPDVSRDDIAKLITASHLHLVRDDVTAGAMASAARGAADMILSALGVQATAIDDGGSFDPTGFSKDTPVILASGEGDTIGRVVEVKRTDGELHTVRVAWPDGTTSSHHPTELVTVPESIAGE